ncbi:hypothetical protein B0H19DRAFT_1109552 [Mycena capillaripes]|nr:hypothetical protein B0H19DRAFT_1109552 [Mycena capillaripes]
MNTEANRILVGRTFEALHDYGVHWGRLKNLVDFRHAIIDVNAPGLSNEDLLNGKAPCYIVGFSEAQANHECARRVPVIPLGSFLPIKEVGCEEIASLLLLFKFMRREPTRISGSEAREWHVKYSELHPDQDNMDVMIAQRARLYPDIAPVYPQLRVSFEGEGEYPKAIISRNRADSDEEETTPTADRATGFRSDSMSPEPAPDPLATVADELALARLEEPVASKV